MLNVAGNASGRLSVVQSERKVAASIDRCCLLQTPFNVWATTAHEQELNFMLHKVRPMHFLRYFSTHLPMSVPQPLYVARVITK